MMGPMIEAIQVMVLGAVPAEGEATSAMAIAPGGHATNLFEHYSEMLLFAVVDLGFVVIFGGLVLCLLRLVKGPTLIDRGVAADTVAFQVVGLVILLSVRLGSLIDFDAVLIVSILGFVSTVAFAQFIGRRGAAA